MTGKPGLIGESLGDTVVLAFTPSEISKHGHAGVLHVMSLKSFHPKMGTFNVSIFAAAAAAAAAAAKAATGTVTLGDTLLGSRPQARVRNLEEHEATDRLCDFNTSSAGRHLPLLASKVIDSKWSQEISEISIDEITFPLEAFSDHGHCLFVQVTIVPTINPGGFRGIAANTPSSGSSSGSSSSSSSSSSSKVKLVALILY